MKKIVLYLFCLWCCFMPGSIVFTQEISIIDINTDNFPIIEAVFKTRNIGSSFLPGFNLHDFSVEEKNKEIEVFQVTNPKKTFVPLSIVLVLDISGSMNEERMAIVTDAAKNFIHRIQLEYSEIAILTFNDEVYINCDFTRDKQRLLLELTDLVPSGGTNYDKAFLNDAMGALEVVREGINKKVVVFLTDGLSSVNTEHIIKAALNDDIEIYTVTIELPVPPGLREISQLSGGSAYEAMQSAHEIEKVYTSILTKIQSDLYGRVYWRAECGCDRDRKGILYYKDMKLNYAYQIPESKISKVSLSSPGLNFSSVAVGETQQQILTIRAGNTPVVLDRASISGEIFSVDNMFTFPDTILPDRNMDLVVHFSPTEQGITKDWLRISFSNCPDQLVSLAGGEKEKIEILHPKGGEKFTTNYESQITWGGVKNDHAVDVFFRLVDTLDWNMIGTSTGGSVAWKVPSDTSEFCQIRLVPKAVELPGMEMKYRADLNGYSPTTIASHKSRQAFALVGDNGELRVYTNNGSDFTRAFGFSSRGICFSKEEMLLSVSRSEVSSHSLAGVTHTIYSGKKRILNAVPLEDGGEFYIPSGARRLNSAETIIYSPLNGYHDTIWDSSPVRYAAVTIDGQRILTLNADNVLKLLNGNTKELIALYILKSTQSTYIINPNSRTALVKLPDNKLEMIELDKGEKVFELSDYEFKKFSASGDYFIVSTKDSVLYCIDSYKGNLLYILNETSDFYTVNSGYGLIQYMNDTLCYIDINTNLKLKKLYIPLLHSSKLSPDDRKLLLLRYSGDHTILSMPDMKEIASFRTRPASFYMASFSFDSRDILLTIDNKELTYWSPPLLEFEKAVSGKFSIIQPCLNIPDTIWLENYSTGADKLQVIPCMVSNTSGVPVVIEKIEISSKDTSFIYLVERIEDKLLTEGDSLSVELGFRYTTVGKNCNELIIFTEFDTLNCKVCGMGEKVKVQLLDKYIDLGQIALNNSIDTILNIRFHELSDTFRTDSIYNIGPDTDQIILSDARYSGGSLLKDSLLLQLKFRGTHRGRTSAKVNILLAESEVPICIYLFGEVSAPRQHTLIGKVLNREDSSAIQAEVSIIDLESGTTIIQSNSAGPKGFDLTINADRAYGLFANSSGYFSGSLHLDMAKYADRDTIYTNIFLTPSRSGAIVQLNCIFFDHNSAVLQDKSYPELMILAGFMRENPDMEFEIHGHTDNTGSKAYNVQLSAERAKSVMEFLVSGGIEANRLSIVAWGAEKPVASNKSEEGRAQNRRVEVLLR